MQLVTWKRDHGFTFAVIFGNGTSGAEYIGLNPKTGKRFEWTEAQATSASEKFRTMKGDNWELGNLHYDKLDPTTGEKIALFRHVSFTG